MIENSCLFDRATEPGSRRGWGALLVALLPVLAAIWVFPGFITQDGPAHLYNAAVLADLLRPGSSFHAVYQVKWQPLPNWGGHLLLMGLLPLVSPRVADCLVTSATFLAPAAAAFWLRGRVAGWRRAWVIVPLIVLCSSSFPWLLGFNSFLLGVALYSLTLGLWWVHRDRWGLRESLVLAGLLVLNYFCHLVSLGLTVFGLIVLALAAPGSGRARRFLILCTSFLPIVPLIIVYRFSMRQGGAIEPIWGHLTNPLSARSWLAQVGWVDSLSLASKLSAPFAGGTARWHFVFAPVIWAAIGIIALLVGDASRRGPDFETTAHDRADRAARRPWLILAGLLLIGGLVCPDTVGPAHGNYLSQRVVLLGLFTLVPVIGSRSDRPLIMTMGAIALFIAWGLQTAFVIDYARHANRLSSEYLSARDLVGTRQRVVVLDLDLKQPFRANPHLHAYALLGIGTCNFLWNDYETAHYYFPLQVRSSVPHPSPLELEELAIHDDPAFATERSAQWKQFLEEHHDEIDVLVLRGDVPAEIARSADRWFVFSGRAGPIQVLKRRA